MNLAPLVRLPWVPERTPPPALVRQLREIDRTHEIVYAGDDWWWLGSVRPTDIRRQAGERMLRSESERPTKNQNNVLLARMLVDGFALIVKLRCSGTIGVEPTFIENGERVNVVEYARMLYHRMYEDPEQGEAAFSAALRVASKEAAREQNRKNDADRIYGATDAWRYGRSRPKSVTFRNNPLARE